MSKAIKRVTGYIAGVIILGILLLALTELMKYSFSLIGGGDDVMLGAAILFAGLAFLILLALITAAHFFKSE